MPTVDVAKIKLRRGSNSDRKLVTLDEGELGYTTDTNRVYVGNGTTFGGSPTSVYNFGSDQRTDGLVQQKAELGDLIFDSNSFGATLLYTLTGVAAAGDAAWMQLSPQVDKSTIEYNAAGKLALASGATVTGGDSITVTANKVSVDYDGADTNTTTFFDIAGTDSGQLKVKNNALTDESHGGLSFETSSGTLLHPLALPTPSGAAADGFMSVVFANTTYYAPDWFTKSTTADANLTPQGAGNRTVSVINDADTQINGTRVDFSSSIITNTVQSSNALKKVVGQSSSSSNISAVDMMTPNNFFNREDFPGTVMRTAIPNANIDNVGNYANFTITDVAFPAVNWADKAFLLPGGNGVIYGVFVVNTGNIFDLVELYPQVTWLPAIYDTDGATIRTNIIETINSFTNSNGERIFDAWQKLDNLSSTVYIQGLVKGKTPSWATAPEGLAFAQTNLDNTYRVIDVGSSTEWVNADTSITFSVIGNSGSGDNAGTNSSGKIGSGMYGWVNLNAQGSDTFQQTLCCTGFKARHTIAQFPAAADCTNGEYFLIYDTNWNRTCVYYFQTGTTEVVPNISTNPTHRGRKTEMIMVEYPEETGGSPTTSDELATATKNALELNTYFNSVYTVTYASPTMTFDSVDVGWTDGIVQREGVFPGCIAPAGTEIQFITNIFGLSGEPNSSALLAAFYNTYESGSTGSPLFTRETFVLPQISSEALVYNVTLPSTDVDSVNCTSLLKYR